MINKRRKSTMIIAVTGHRPNKLGNAYKPMHPTNIKLGKLMRKFILEKSVYKKETNSFETDELVWLVSGMALGADTIWAMVALKLRKEFPDKFRVECAIPCLNHPNRWNKEDQERHAMISESADFSEVITKEEYKPYMMQVRNEYMVNKADVLLAIWDGTKGGTANCVNYAKKKNVKIYRYHPFMMDDYIEYLY